MRRLDPASLIITRPEKGLNLRKVASAANFVLFWGLALYVMRYLIEIAAWVFFYVFFNRVIGDLKLQDVVSIVFGLYLPIIVCVSLALWGWAAYNRFRYGGVRDKRRVPPPQLATEQVGEYTNLPVEKIKEMGEAKVLICYFDKDSEFAWAAEYDSVDHATEVLDTFRKSAAKR